MIHQITALASGSATQDTALRIPASGYLICVDFAGDLVVSAASTGTFAFIAQLWRGSPMSRYGDNTAYADATLLAQHFDYVSQGTANANLKTNSGKVIPGLQVLLRANELVTLRIVSPSNSTFHMDCLLYMV